MDLSLDAIGAIHTLVCLYAMVVGAQVLFGLKGGPVHRTRGKRYVYAQLAVNITALMIYTTRGFGVFHWMAVATLLSLAVAYGSARWKKPRGAWLRIHLTAMVFSYYMLWGGSVNEVFEHVTALKAYGSGPVIGGVHTLLMLITLMAMAYFWGKTSRPVQLAGA